MREKKSAEKKVFFFRSSFFSTTGPILPHGAATMLIRIDMKSYDVECPSGFVAEHLGAPTLSLDFQRAAQRGQGSVRGKQSLNFDVVVWSEKKHCVPVRC